MDPFEVLVPLIAVVSIFVGMPWIILHYTTRWKQAKSITLEDEDLLDELYDIARRLDDRMNSVERIIAADRDELRRVPDLRADLRTFEPRQAHSPELRSVPRKEI